MTRRRLLPLVPLTYTDPDGHMALDEKDTGGTVTKTSTTIKRKPLIYKKPNRDYRKVVCGFNFGDFCGSWFDDFDAELQKPGYTFTVEPRDDTYLHKVAGSDVGDFVDGMNVETGNGVLGAINMFRNGSLCQWGKQKACDSFAPMFTAEGWKSIGNSFVDSIQECRTTHSARSCGGALQETWTIATMAEGGTGLTKSIVKMRKTALADAASASSTKSATASRSAATASSAATSGGLLSAFERFATGLDDVLTKLGGKGKAPKVKGPRPGSGKTGGTKSGSAKTSSGKSAVTGCTHSFAPGTLVVMANGSTKPIKDVQVGDKVLASDSRTGDQEPKAVTALHKNDDVDLADITVTDTETGKSSVINTTWHHPFWNADSGDWTDAKDLKPGTHLLDADGKAAMMVTAVKTWTGLQRMHDLTVADIHTYYVIAGDTSVLVHNCGDALKHSESNLANSIDENTYFHYTDADGHAAIMDGGVVQANSKGVSYFTQDMVSSGDANNVLFAGNPGYAGRGTHVIAFRMPEGVLRPGVQPNEMIHIGSFRFSPEDVIYHGLNPFG